MTMISGLLLPQRQGIVKVRENTRVKLNCMKDPKRIKFTNQ